MAMSGTEQILQSLEMIFPGVKFNPEVISCVRDEKSLNSFIDEQFATSEKTKSFKTTVAADDSDDELMKELEAAVKAHKSNKKKEREPKIMPENGFQNQEPESFDVNGYFDFQPPPEEIQDLVKMIAPQKRKNMRRANKKKLKEYQNKLDTQNIQIENYGYKKREEIEKCRNFVNNQGGERKRNEFGNKRSPYSHVPRKPEFKTEACQKKIPTNKKIPTVDKVQVLDEDPAPFYYVVPQNPSPDFFFPCGLYYVVPQSPSVMFEGKVVFHPERSEHSHKTNNESKSEEFIVPSPQNSNNLEKDTSNRMVFQSNIELGESLDSKNITTQNLNEIMAAKSELEAKIQELKSRLAESLESLNRTESSLNLATNFSSDKNLYEKTIANGKGNEREKEEKLTPQERKQYEHMIALFPDSDRDYLKRKVAECHGNYELFLELIESECLRLEEISEGVNLNRDFKLLLLTFPTHTVQDLYEIWAQCVGDEEELLRLIDKEKEHEKKKKAKRLQQKLLSEFSDLTAENALEIAKKHLSDDQGFQNFIETKRRIQNQLQVMITALPDSDPEELRGLCEGFQGDEQLVRNYIEETTRKNIKLQRVLDLQFIFPDADPQFLRQKVEDLNDDEDCMDRLTMKLLECNDYPKIAKQSVSLEQKKLWDTYVKNFNAHNYLLKVPNPKERFSGGRTSNYDLKLVLWYLGCRYRDVPESRLRTAYEHYDNLTSVCKHLNREFDPVRLHNFPSFRNAEFNETFLQEVCYIENETEINYFFDERKRRKKLEEEEARILSAFLTCPLCAEEELLPSEVVTCPDGHVFCRECIQRYVDVKMGDGTYKITCPSTGCNMSFTHSTLEQLLPESLLLKIVKKEQAEEISTAQVDGLEFCRYCEFAYIPNPDDKIFKCQNPDCSIETCRKCLEKNHIPLRCEEIERPMDVEARKKIEETMTEALVRKCPTCGKKFLRTSGCNKIVCPCGTFICYLCRIKINGYDHFQGHGGRCPLYTDDRILHTQDVLRRGVETRDRILQENPDLRIFHDPTTSSLP